MPSYRQISHAWPSKHWSKSCAMRPGPPHTREVNRRKIPANSANLPFRLVQSGHIQPAEDSSSGRLQTNKFFCICPPRILPTILRRAVLRKSFCVSLLAPAACLLPTAFQRKRDWDRISDTKRRHTSRPGLANGKNAGMRVASAGPANRHSREEKSSDPNVRRYLPSP